jgi:hypothetical protein
VLDTTLLVLVKSPAEVLALEYEELEGVGVTISEDVAELLELDTGNVGV